MLETFLRIQPEEATFSKRGFWSGNPSARDRLEHIGQIFLEGYHRALTDQSLEGLGERLNTIESAFRGYGFEGAAMALDLLDQLKPWTRRRIPVFLAGPGAPHVYMVHVGIGWSLARFRHSWALRISHLDPLFRWLTIDGLGFHEGYFHWPRYANGTAPKGLQGYSLRAFDQGLGRSLWFVGSADPAYIAAAILGFQPSRQADLWSGVGLACAYAGGVEGADIMMLGIAAGAHWPHVAQGTAFAAKAREHAGNWAQHTDLACRLISGLSAEQAAGLTDRTLQKAVADSEPAYEVWRRIIRTHFSSHENEEVLGHQSQSQLRGSATSQTD
jgi:enediyne biosynthesis protein E3